MGAKSKIAQLPKELQDLINGLLRSDTTIRAISEKLWELVENGSITEEQVPGKSAIGTYKQKMDRMFERLKRSRMMAEVAVEKFGAAPESKTARLNIEMTHALLLDVMAAADDGESLSLDPMQVMLLAKAQDHLAGAAKKDSDLLEKAQAAANKRAADKAVKAVTQAGLSEDKAEFIRRDILGIGQEN